MIWLIPVGLGLVGAAAAYALKEQKELEELEHTQQAYLKDLERQLRQLEQQQYLQEQQYRHEALQETLQAHQRGLKSLRKALKPIKANLKAIQEVQEALTQDLNQLIGLRQGCSEADCLWLDTEIAQRQDLIAENRTAQRALKQQKQEIKSQIAAVTQCLWNTQGQLESEGYTHLSHWDEQASFY